MADNNPADMFTIEATISPTDGALVILIETNEDLLPCNSEGPTPLRVYINDGDTIYANPDLDLP